MPPGRYFVGDPSYIFSDAFGYDWVSLVPHLLRLDGEPFEVDGHKVVCYPAAPSEDLWTYVDEDETRYEAPSGFLGLIPEALIRRPHTDLADCGCFYAPRTPIKVSLSAEYVVQLGDIIIATQSTAPAPPVGHIGAEGTYFIGDPSRAFDPAFGFNWDSIWATLETAEDDSCEIDGERVFAYYTLLPKGTFTDQVGGRYRVDSGMIVVVPYALVADVPDLELYGRIAEFELPFGTVQTPEGLIQVGSYAISTDHEQGKDEYSMTLRVTMGA
jgi:hypothetical protein